MKSFVMLRRFFTISIACFVILLVCGYLGRKRMYCANRSQQIPDILCAWGLSVFKICDAPALVSYARGRWKEIASESKEDI